MDEIDAVLEMSGMKEGVRTWVVTSKKGKDDPMSNIEIPGMHGGVAR